MKQETQLAPRRSAWRWPSIQRYGWVRERDARWLADTYFRWLDESLPFTRATVEGTRVRLHVRPFDRPAIELEQRKSAPDVVGFEVVDGFLAHGPSAGTFEFAQTSEGAQVVLRDYRPALPRLLYFLTQAMVHAIVMWLFGRYLRRHARGSP